MYLFYPIEASEIHHPYLSNLQRDPANFFNSARFGTRKVHATDNSLDWNNAYPHSKDEQNKLHQGYLDALNIYNKQITDSSGGYLIDMGMSKFYSSGDKIPGFGLEGENWTNIEDYQPIKFEWKYNNVQGTDFVSCECITINPDYNVLVLVPNPFNPIHSIRAPPSGGGVTGAVQYHWLSNTQDTDNQIQGAPFAGADAYKKWYIKRGSAA